MLTGELPGKRIEPPSRKVQIDVRLDEVVLRALEKKPELRYQQVSEVKTMVESISSSSSPVTGPAPSPARPAATRGRLTGRVNRGRSGLVVRRGDRNAHHVDSSRKLESGGCHQLPAEIAARTPE